MLLPRHYIIGIAGVLLFVFGILYKTVILPSTIRLAVKKKAALKSGGIMRDAWGNHPIISDISFYVFNVTNADSISQGDQPKVQEIGPLVYEELHEKIHDVDDEGEDTVSYRTRDTYFFQSEKSHGLTGNEEIVLSNIFGFGLANLILYTRPSAVPMLGKAIDGILHKPASLFMKAKFKDLLFDGIPFECSTNEFPGVLVCNELRNQYQDLNMIMVEKDRYLMSFLGKKNGSYSKTRTRVSRGSKNLMDVGKVVEYNGKKNISTWKNQHCDTFYGTDGSVYHPFLNRKGKDKLTFFSAEFCRNIECNFDSIIQYGGKQVLRYTADYGTDGNNNIQDRCYCFLPKSCLKKGAYDVYKCLNMPLVISNPHFYLADPYYIDSVNGLKPVKEEHSTIIDIDPLTGIPLRVIVRQQYNMFIRKIAKYKVMENYPDVLLPLFWMEKTTILPDFLVQKITHEGYTVKVIGMIIQYLLMAIGLGLCGFAGFKHYRLHRGRNRLVHKAIAPENNNCSSAKN